MDLICYMAYAVGGMAFVAGVTQLLKFFGVSRRGHADATRREVEQGVDENSQKLTEQNRAERRRRLFDNYNRSMQAMAQLSGVMDAAARNDFAGLEHRAMDWLNGGAEPTFSYRYREETVRVETVQPGGTVRLNETAQIVMADGRLATAVNTGDGSLRLIAVSSQPVTPPAPPAQPVGVPVLSLERPGRTILRKPWTK